MTAPLPQVIPALSTRHRDEIAQLRISLQAAERGYCCSRPLMEGCRYDLILDDGEQLYRVQCKYVGSLIRGAVDVALTKMSGGMRILRTYTAKEIDAVLVYVAVIDKILWLPIEMCAGKTTVSLGVHPAGNNQKKGILWMEDFVW